MGLILSVLSLLIYFCQKSLRVLYSVILVIRFCLKTKLILHFFALDVDVCIYKRTKTVQIRKMRLR